MRYIPSLKSFATAGLSTLGGVILSSIWVPRAAYAWGNCPGTEVELPVFGCIPVTVSDFAGRVLNLGIGLGTLLAVLFLVIGGFGVATSAGNPDNLEKAKGQITAAVAGLVFILLSVMILNIIGETIGIGNFPFQ